MAQLTFDAITKRFEDDDGSEIVAVDDLDLTVRDGEFLILVGPSGCGKSTTLRMTAGLVAPSEGRISLGDTEVTHDSPGDRDMAMVFQSYALYPHMTVRGNMRFGLEESTDLPSDEIDARVEESAAMMGIDDLLDRKPGELSGGQQQRVALGRAIVREPEVFLMDEPLSNLDAKLRSQMRTELQRLQEDLETTTIYVTHDQTEAMTMGDRVAILDDGELQQVGTPIECYHQPNNQFVAGFIGEPSMNFIPVTRQGDALVADDFEYPIGDEIREQLDGARDLVLGVRPEDVVVGADGGDHAFEAVIDVVEPMGSANNLHFLLSDLAAGSTFVAMVGGMRAVAAGSEVTLSLPEDAVHVFDAHTGEALRNRVVEDTDFATRPAVIE